MQIPTKQVNLSRWQGLRNFEYHAEYLYKSSSTIKQVVALLLDKQQTPRNSSDTLYFSKCFLYLQHSNISLHTEIIKRDK